MAAATTYCPNCEASQAGCDTLQTLGGRRCCGWCAGDHGSTTTEGTTDDHHR